MWFSVAVLILLVANGIFEWFSRTVLLYSAIQSKFFRKTISPQIISKSISTNDFVSTHIAICNEPPDLVIATLSAIASIKFDNFEVIVIDNNTSDPALWRPVEHAMCSLGGRFRFYHFESLAGAKAGALNVALDKMDPRATYVAVVDADYQICSTFFSDAINAVQSSGADYVQFPQAYRGVGTCGRGVEQELGDYFACFASGAGRRGSMLPTGTLSVFFARVLLEVGGWSASTITEDAELGVRLQAAGYRGTWRAEKAGHGLLPVDFPGLARQRARWAAGNMQVLLQVVRNRKMALSYLTAWISFWGLPAFAIIAVALIPTLPLSGAIGMVASSTIVFSIVLTSLRMYMLAERREDRRRVHFSAFAAKLALSWVSSFAWLPALTKAPLRFHRTPKSPNPNVPDKMVALFVISLVFALISVAFLVSRRPLEASACIVLSSIWGCARWTDRCLRITAALNAKAL
jgi:cellulose synthase/poly-beta-1,6-N-acetylglucosamine synthase-like glycosyltransferase